MLHSLLSRTASHAKRLTLTNRVSARSLLCWRLVVLAKMKPRTSIGTLSSLLWRAGHDPKSNFVLQASSSYFKNDKKWICTRTPAIDALHGKRRLNTVEGGSSLRASIAINKRIIKLGAEKDWRGILLLFEQEGGNFSNVNYATAMVQLGRSRTIDRSDPSFQAFLNSLWTKINVNGLSWIGVRQTANIVHAIGKLKLRNQGASDVLDWIAREDIAKEFVHGKVERADAQNMANTVWAFANLQKQAPMLLANIEDRSDWLVQNGEPQHVANTVWAFATLKTEAPILLSAIEARSDWLVQNGTPQCVANTVWAFATLQTEAPLLMAQIETRSDWLVRNGTPQAVANTAWAFAVLKTKAPMLWSAIDARSDWLVQNGTPQSVSNTVWALATLRAEAPKFLAAIGARADWLIQNSTPQGIANTAWALGALKTKAPNILTAIEARSDWLVENGTPQSVSNTVWALATLLTEPPTLLAAIEAKADWLVYNAKPQEISNTVWAFATLETEAPRLLAAIDARADWLVQNGNAQVLSNTAWAFATLGFEASMFFDEVDRNPMSVLGNESNPQTVANSCFAIATALRIDNSRDLLQKLWDRAIELFEADAVSFVDVAFWQLAQTQIFAKAWGVDLSPCPVSLSRKMEETIKAFTAEDNSVSRSSKELSLLLEEIGFEHECEVPPAGNILGGIMAIDFACTKRKVAIEFDGVAHFLKALGSGGLTSQRNGPTIAKRRLLQQLGWTVINLDFRDYIESIRILNQKEWLMNELKQSGVALPEL